MAQYLTPRAREVLDYLQAKGRTTPREALLDLDINSGSFTRRITELKDAGYPIEVTTARHPISRRRYNVYTYAAHD